MNVQKEFNLTDDEMKKFIQLCEINKLRNHQMIKKLVKNFLNSTDIVGNSTAIEFEQNEVVDEFESYKKSYEGCVSPEEKFFSFSQEERKKLRSLYGDKSNPANW